MLSKAEASIRFFAYVQNKKENESGEIKSLWDERFR